MDRERTGLQNQEKKLIAEIKKMAKQGQMVRSLCSLAPPILTVPEKCTIPFRLQQNNTVGNGLAAVSPL